MAIKTKKITDLGTINVAVDGAGSLTDSDFFLIGCKSGITGKVETKALVNAINQNTNSLINKAYELLVNKSDVDVDVNNIKRDVKSLTNNVNDLKVVVSGIASSPAPISTGCDCAEKIAALEAKVAALEGFVKALQADGYLTLANIKKAAADACPVEASAE